MKVPRVDYEFDLDTHVRRGKGSGWIKVFMNKKAQLFVLRKIEPRDFDTTWIPWILTFDSGHSYVAIRCSNGGLAAHFKYYKIIEEIGDFL